MKVLAIRGKNIASLEGEYTIDFTAEPLLSAGIFAISGPTGSGKSTLLDTMCLALFARTPRTDQAKENEIWLRDVKDSNLRQGDPRNLLRRGTAAGYAEVDFVALNGHRYRSRWFVRRARDKESGALQDFRISLFNLDTGTEEQGNKKDLQIRITELIGLTFDQFTRSVLLAQNDFSTFLKADQSEKASLLEKLTGTELYSGISQLIYEKNAVAKEAYDQIKARIDGVELLTEDELLQLQEKQQQTEVLLSTLSKAKVTLENKQKWFAQRAEWQNSVQQAVNEVSDTLRMKEQSASRFEYLRQIDQVQEARTLFDAVKSSGRTIIARQEQLEQINLQVAQIKQQKELAYEQYELRIREQQISEQHYQAFEPQMQQARKLDVQIEEASRLVTDMEPRMKNVSDERLQGERRLQSLSKQLNVVLEEIQSLTRWKEQHAAKEPIAERRDILLLQLDRAEVSFRNAEQSRQNIKNWEQSLSRNEKLLNAKSEAFTEKERERKKQEEALQNLEFEHKQTDYEKLHQEIETYRSKREQYVYEQALLTSKDITALRGKLAEGLPCPLCGSEHHPYANADIHLQHSFSSLIEAVDLKLKELRQTETEYLARQKKLSVLHEQHFALHKEVTELEKEVSALTAGQLLTHNKIMGEQELLREQTELLNEALNATNKLFDGDQWQIAWQSNPEIFREKLTDFARQWQRNKEELRDKESIRERIHTEYESFKVFYPSLQKREEEVRLEYITRQKQVSVLKKERNALFDGKPVTAIEQEYKEKTETLKQQVALALKAQNETSHRYEQTKGTATQIEQDLAAIRIQAQEYKEQLTNWLHSFNTERENPLSDQLLAELLSKDTFWIKTERDALNSLNAAYITATAKLQEREEKLKVHELQRDELQIGDSTPEELFLLQQANEEEIRMQTSSLNEFIFKLRRHRENKEKIKNLEEELNAKRMVSEQWAKLNELAGSSDGGKFRRIAQGYTLDILLSYANIQLRALSKRYRLERVPETLALQVIDRDMCDEVRTVHSLSGGESFLVSLALALGLSSLSSNRMKVESLFIDEGFGSLDAETLRIAMDALESLRTQGRKIGVISHVQEMTERISVQINVEKAGNGKSSIRILG